jgi:hypothetical protein
LYPEIFFYISAVKKILSFIFVLSFHFSFGQATFIKGYYASYQTILYCVQQTSDSGFIAIGVSELPIGGLIIMKTDSMGDTLWTRLFSNLDRMLWPSDVYQTMNGDFLITGPAQYGNNLSDAYIMRVSSIGNIIWNKILDVGNIDNGSSIIETNAGDLIMVGGCDGSVGGYGKMFLVKTNSAGDLIFAKTFNGNLSAGGASITPADSGEFFILGGVDGSSLIMKVDSLGDVLWAKSYSGWNFGFPRTLNTRTDSSIIMMGDYVGSEIGIARTDIFGNVQWSKVFNGHNIVLLSIIDSNDGGYIITGQRSDTVTFNNYGFALKLNYLGDTVWCRNYNLNVSGISCASLTDDGGIILSGGLTNNGPGLIKTDSNGHSDCGEENDNWNIGALALQLSSPTLITDTVLVNTSSLTFIDTGVCNTNIICSSVGIKAESHFRSTDFILSPNPTTGKLKINNEELKIEAIHVYNLFGKVVMSLPPADEIDLTSLSDGMYIVEVSSEDFLWRMKVLKTDY